MDNYDKLIGSLENEMQAFKDSYKDMSASQTYNDWYIIGFYEEYYEMFTSGFIVDLNVADDTLAWLATKDKPLEFLYDKWMSCDGSFSHNWDDMLDWVNVVYREEKELGLVEENVPKDKIMVAILDAGYYEKNGDYPEEYRSEYAHEVYLFDTPEEFIQKWDELNEGDWYWVYVDGDAICSGAIDPNDIGIFEDYWNKSFDDVLTFPRKLQEEIEGLNIRAVQNAPDEYFESFDFITHISRSPVVISAKLTNNTDRDLNEQAATFFNHKLLVRSCDYGCDTYPGGISKAVSSDNVQTYQQKVWDFIEDVEGIFGCECRYFTEVNGFEFVFEFGEDENKGCYVFGAGNNGQEFSQVLYFNDVEQFKNADFVNAVTAIDKALYVLLNNYDLSLEDKKRVSSLKDKINDAKQTFTSKSQNESKAFEDIDR